MADRKRKPKHTPRPLTRQDLVDRVNRSCEFRQYSMRHFNMVVCIARQKMLASPDEITRLAKGQGRGGKPRRYGHKKAAALRAVAKR